MRWWECLGLFGCFVTDGGDFFVLLFWGYLRAGDDSLDIFILFFIVYLVLFRGLFRGLGLYGDKGGWYI